MRSTFTAMLIAATLWGAPIRTFADPPGRAEGRQHARAESRGQANEEDVDHGDKARERLVEAQSELELAAREAAAHAREASEKAREATLRALEDARRKLQDAREQARETLESNREQAKDALARGTQQAAEALDQAREHTRKALLSAADALREGTDDLRRVRMERWAELKRRLHRADDDSRGPPPELSAELRVHGTRIAELARIRALAEDAKDRASITRTDELIAAENQRHEQELARITTTPAPQPTPGKALEAGRGGRP